MKTAYRYGVLMGSVLLLFIWAPRILQAQGYVEGTFQRTLTVSGSTNLEAATGSGRIEVRPGPAGRVEVQAQVRIE